MRSQRRLYRNQSGISIGAPNTFIGGVASVLNTPELVASKLSYLDDTNLSSNDVYNFTITGNDISFFIGINFKIGIDAFWHGGTEWNHGAILTHFRHNDVFLKEIRDNGFTNQINLLDFKIESVEILKVDSLIQTGAKKYELPNCVSVTRGCFAFLPNVETIYLPVCVTYGNLLDVGQVFLSSKTKFRLYPEPSMATINAGAEEGDIAYARNTLFAKIGYVNNYTKPETPINLTITETYLTALTLELTQPVSVNTIDYYEVYVNGLEYSKITGNGDQIVGLNDNTSYQIAIIAVDVKYNKSIMSNAVNGTTTAQGIVPVAGLISYYKLDETSGGVLDSQSTNHGVNNGVARGVLAKIGNGFSFNGSTDVLLNYSAFNLSKGSISLWVKSSDFGSNYRGLVSKDSQYGILTQNNILLAYSWGAPTGVKSTEINIANNVWQHIVMTFVQGVTNGTKIYLNGNLVLTNTIGNATSSNALYLGRNASSQRMLGLMDEVCFYNKIISQVEVLELHNNGNGVTL